MRVRIAFAWAATQHHGSGYGSLPAQYDSEGPARQPLGQLQLDAADDVAIGQYAVRKHTIDELSQAEHLHSIAQTAKFTTVVAKPRP